MDKEDSLKLLENCIDNVTNASDEDIEMFQMKYDMYCTELLTSSEFEFVPPTKIFK